MADVPAVTRFPLPNGDVFVDANENSIVDEVDWIERKTPQGTAEGVMTGDAYLEAIQFPTRKADVGKPVTIAALADYVLALQMCRHLRKEKSAYPGTIGCYDRTRASDGRRCETHPELAEAYTGHRSIMRTGLLDISPRAASLVRDWWESHLYWRAVQVRDPFYYVDDYRHIALRNVDWARHPQVERGAAIMAAYCQVHEAPCAMLKSTRDELAPLVEVKDPSDTGRTIYLLRKLVGTDNERVARCVFAIHEAQAAIEALGNHREPAVRKVAHDLDKKFTADLHMLIAPAPSSE